MYNKATLIGNLGQDPEVRSTQNGKVCTLSVATSESWKDKDGIKQERTEWHRVVIFKEKVITNFIEQYLHKGDTVMVIGSIRTRKWTDQNGTEKYTTEIVVNSFSDDLKLIKSKKDGASNSQASAPPPKPQASINDELDDDIPF